MIEDGLLALLLGSMILLASGQILLRNLFDSGLVWADPLLRLLVLWVGLLGALAATREPKHISIDVFLHLMPVRSRAAVQVITALFAAAVSGIVAWHGARFVEMDFQAQATAFAGLPAWVLELVIPFAFGMIAIRYALHCAGHARAMFSAENAP